MSEDNLVSTRRRVLQGATSALALSATAGVGTATTAQVEINVGYKNRRGRRAAQQAADRINREFNFDAVAIRASPQAAEALDRNPNIRYVEENGKLWPVGQTTPYGITQVEADISTSNGDTGEGVSVAILDTGIDPAHEDLAANIGQGLDCVDGDCTESVADPDGSHGTAVAGVAGAVDNELGVVGVGPAITLHSVKVLSEDGGTYDAVAAGIEASADAGYDIQNMSFGGGDSNLVRDAMQYAAARGVVMVAAAGNGRCDDCVIFPASADETIAVSATDENDKLASFSSTGPEIDLAAPGLDVLTTLTDDRYGYASGTSLAAPHVSAAAAVVIASGVIDREEVKKRLTESADDIGLSDNQQGDGRLNVASAVESDSEDEDEDETTAESVTVTTETATDIGGSSATLNGTLTELSGLDAVEVAFEYGPAGDGLTESTASQTLSSTGSFSEPVESLAAGTDYEFQAVAVAGDTSGTGDVLQFVTDDDETDDNTAPTIDDWSVRTRTTGPWFRASSTWSVSDDNGNLDTVTTELLDGSSVVDVETTAVSGATASDEHKTRTRGNADSIRLTVTDEDGSSTTEKMNL